MDLFEQMVQDAQRAQNVIRSAHTAPMDAVQDPEDALREIKNAVINFAGFVATRATEQNIPTYQFVSDPDRTRKFHLSPTKRREEKARRNQPVIHQEGWLLGAETYRRGYPAVEGIKPDPNNPVARAFKGILLNRKPGPILHRFISNGIVDESARQLSAGPNLARINMSNLHPEALDLIYRGLQKFAVENLDLSRPNRN